MYIIDYAMRTLLLLTYLVIMKGRPYMVSILSFIRLPTFLPTYLRTYIHTVSAMRGHADIILYLIKTHHIDIDHREVSYQRTALYFACNHGHDRIVEILLKYGADPSLWYVCR